MGAAPQLRPGLALRCKIVLACAEGGRTHVQIAGDLGCNPVTVSKWRNRLATGRPDGLVDAPRPGVARSIGDDVIEAIVVKTLETAPADATHWSTRGLAAKHGISHQTVAEIWRAFGLKPRREDSFKVSPDPELVEKIRDLVGRYLNPPVAKAWEDLSGRQVADALRCDVLWKVACGLALNDDHAAASRRREWFRQRRLRRRSLGRTATCPPGHVVSIAAKGAAIFGSKCRGCPLRSLPDRESRSDAPHR